MLMSECVMRLQADLAAIARLGDAATAQAGERIAAALEGALRTRPRSLRRGRRARRAAPRASRRTAAGLGRELRSETSMQDQTFQVTGPVRLDLRIPNADVTVSAGAPGTASVSSGAGGTLPDDVTVTCERRGDTDVLTVTSKQSGLFRFRH